MFDPNHDIGDWLKIKDISESELNAAAQKNSVSDLEQAYNWFGMGPGQILLKMLTEKQKRGKP